MGKYLHSLSLPLCLAPPNVNTFPFALVGCEMIVANSYPMCTRGLLLNISDLSGVILGVIRENPYPTPIVHDQHLNVTSV